MTRLLLGTRAVVRLPLHRLLCLRVQIDRASDNSARMPSVIRTHAHRNQKTTAHQILPSQEYVPFHSSLYREWPDIRLRKPHPLSFASMRSFLVDSLSI